MSLYVILLNEGEGRPLLYKIDTDNHHLAVLEAWRTYRELSYRDNELPPEWARAEVVEVPQTPTALVDPALLDMVRNDIENAKQNGYDWFGDPLHAATTDRAIGLDLLDCTTGYEDVTMRDLDNAVAAVRREVQG